MRRRGLPQGESRSTRSKASSGLRFLRVTQVNLPELAEGLSALEQAVQGRHPDPSTWSWRYLENPLGESTTVVAIRDGRVVGRLGGVHLPIVIEGERQVACLMEGLSVLPVERSWECLRGLLAASAEECRGSSVSLFFAFATRVSAALNRRLGHTILGPTPIWSGFLDVSQVLRDRSFPGALAGLGKLAGPLVGVRRGTFSVAGVETVPVKHFDTQASNLWQSVEPLRGIAVVKDASFLEWRYDRCPGRAYRRLAAQKGGQLEGLAVYALSLTRKDGYILELIARNDNLLVLRQLVAGVLTDMSSEGVGLVSASFPHGSAAAETLAALGFKTWGTWFWRMQTIIAGHWFESGSPASLHRWDFSLGDWLYH